MPVDLSERIHALDAAFEQLDQRLTEIEGRVQALAHVAKDVGSLRHDFNSTRTIVNVLLEEVDRRLPIPKTGRTDGKR